MKTRAVILAGGEGSRLGVLTAKRTKPAVMFAGKYRIIDFTLSNCVNSRINDIMIVAQYRPHSLIDHLGNGGPWDLNREWSGGLKIYTPYKARHASDWFVGTADAVQQNFLFIKRDQPDLVIILSGDHIYGMNYQKMIDFHLQKQADLTVAAIRVPHTEASRFGIIGIDDDNKITSFVEKPPDPPSDLANMGVYIFNLDVLDKALWEDHLKTDSDHDFGKNILPALIHSETRVFAYPYDGYWIDVGTISSYWQAHMDLLADPPPFDLNDRSWVIHTRTEERPPLRVASGAVIEDSMISHGCIIDKGARVIRSILSPGVHVHAGAVVEESILFTNSDIGANSIILRTIADKRVIIGENSKIGGITPLDNLQITSIGKSSILPAEIIVEPGATIGTDVIPSDINGKIIRAGEFIQTRRLPNEI